MAGRGGAVYKLIHDKTNAVNAIRELTETMVSKLESSGEDDEQLTAVLSIFEQRRGGPAGPATQVPGGLRLCAG